MKKHLTLLVVATLCALALYAGPGAGLAHAAPGDIFNLGTLSGTASYGYGINDAGQVTGYSYTPSGEFHAFRYTGTPGSGGAMADLGTLGGANTLGVRINDAGQVAGNSYTNDFPYHRAFRYTGTPGSGGAMADLGHLGGMESQAYGINGAGQVAGWSNTTGGATHAFRYTGTPGSGGAMIDLGTLGGTHSEGYGINDAGQVTGWPSTTGDTENHAFRYSGTPGSGGAMADLGTLGGTAYTVGFAINNAGQVAGGSYTTGNNGTHAFRYTGTPGSGGAMADLGTLGGTDSFAIAIDDAGFVVGVADRAAGTGGGSWATLWQIDAGNTAVDLDAWLDGTNPTLGAYWTLVSAYGINNNGLISGYGYYNDGLGGLTDGTRAFILDASSLVVPEPATLVLLALGLPFLARRNLRRSGSGGIRGGLQFVLTAATQALTLARSDQ